MKHLVILIGFSFVLCSCSPKVTLPEKAFVEPPIISEAITTAEDIDKRSDLPAPHPNDWVVVLKGNVPIIVTAPHATSTLREGKPKPPDGAGTAALAIMLNKLTGVTVVYTNYASPSDPNYYDNNLFKQVLLNLIKTMKPAYLLDIHGSNPYRPYDVDIGTMNGKSLNGEDKLLYDLISILNKQGINNLSYNYFAGSKNNTIIKFASNHGIPSIQLEISSTRLTLSKQDKMSDHRFSELLQALAIFIQKTKAEICQDRICN